MMHLFLIWGLRSRLSAHALAFAPLGEAANPAPSRRHASPGFGLKPGAVLVHVRHFAPVGPSGSEIGALSIIPTLLDRRNRVSYHFCRSFCMVFRLTLSFAR